jgi:hypothetical protein
MLLTDHQLQVVTGAANLVPPPRRDLFLRSVAGRLRELPDKRRALGPTTKLFDLLQRCYSFD